jgi:hypothetical protein
MMASARSDVSLMRQRHWQCISVHPLRQNNPLPFLEIYRLGQAAVTRNNTVFNNVTVIQCLKRRINRLTTVVSQ